GNCPIFKNEYSSGKVFKKISISCFSSRLQTNVSPSVLLTARMLDISYLGGGVPFLLYVVSLPQNMQGPSTFPSKQIISSITWSLSSVHFIMSYKGVSKKNLSGVKLSIFISVVVFV